MASIITPTPFPLEKALEPTTLIAYEMNGATLPDRHGFPARIVVPGYFGEKHVKWFTRIELAGADAEGFYEKQGWGPDFIVPTRSRFDVPVRLSRGLAMRERAPNGIPLKGVAFGGDRGISRVEVSLRRRANLAGSEDRLPGHETDLGALEFRLATERGRRIQAGRARDRWRGRGPGFGKGSEPVLRRDRVPQNHGLPGLTTTFGTGTPGRGAAPDRRPPQRRSMARTFSAGFPSFMHQPAFWRIGIVVADCAERARETKRTTAPESRASSFALSVTRLASRSDVAPAREFRPPSSCRSRGIRFAREAPP